MLWCMVSPSLVTDGHCVPIFGVLSNIFVKRLQTSYCPPHWVNVIRHSPKECISTFIKFAYVSVGLLVFFTWVPSRRYYSEVYSASYLVCIQCILHLVRECVRRMSLMGMRRRRLEGYHVCAAPDDDQLLPLCANVTVMWARLLPAAPYVV